MSKMIMFGEEARKKILIGINKVNDSVKTTLGPRGRTVLIGNGSGSSIITKDGVTVAQSIVLDDEIENEGAKYIREVATKTNYSAGDGTTSSTVIASAMLNFGISNISKYNSVEVKDGINLAMEKVLEFLDKKTIPVLDFKDIKNVGTISANGESEIGELLAKAMEKVGWDGLINIEDGNGFDSELSVVEGMEFDRGYISPYFANQEDLKCVMDNPYILIHDKPIQQLSSIMKILEVVSSEQRGLLIISDGVQGEALSGLILNKKKGILNVCAVPAPEFGELKHNALEDIAILTGGTFINSESGKKLEQVEIEDLGEAKKVIVDSNRTMIIDGLGDDETIQKRIKAINVLIDNSKDDDKEKHKRRLAKLTGGVAVIKVGGKTRTEMIERKYRLEDALNATKASVEDGILPGGGSTLVRAYKFLNDLELGENVSDSVLFGIQVVSQSLIVPIRQILSNIGYDEERAEKVISNILNNNDLLDDTTNIGYDAKNEKYVDMLDSGIVDATKVIKNSIVNSCSIAGTLLTLEVVIVEKLTDGADMMLNL